MALTSVKWLSIVTVTAACCLRTSAAADSQFTSFSDRLNAVLEGHWQSCREDDGQYSERIYDGRLPGMGPFELHMGPYHEFALFRGVREDHRDHNSSANLLRPYNVEVVSNRARQKWEINGIRLEVTLAGGSRDDCESWFVALRRVDTSSQ